MTIRLCQDEIDIMKIALNRWGLNAQANQTIEECAELIVALNKHINRNPTPKTLDNVIDEIADVEIMLAQMRMALEIDDHILCERIERKFGKLNKYLSDEKPC